MQLYLCTRSGLTVRSQIPFSASRAEVIAFFGRNSRIANDDLEPVHIIMDRVSSKTNDAYVEFCTDKDAAEAVEKLEKVAERGRPARIGARPIYAQVVSHERLMRDLFPVARGVDWSGPRPVILPQHDGQFAWEKFKTFITAEEMTMMVKHVETPSRVSRRDDSKSTFQRLTIHATVPLCQRLPRAPL